MLLPDKLLGEGCYAKVFATTDPEVVCKVTPLNTEDLPTSAVREMSALHAFEERKMSNVPRVTKWVLANNQVQMHLSKLAPLLVPVEISKQRGAFLQLLGALRNAHAMKFVHADIKPDNVLVDTKTGTLRLCDWGLCVRRYSATATYCGAFTYSPPESWLEVLPKTDGFAMDVWALGCTFFAMVIGEHMFSGTADAEVLRSQLLTRKSQLRRVSDRTLRSLLKNMVQLNPQDRWTAERCFDFLARSSPEIVLLRDIDEQHENLPYKVDWSKHPDLNYVMRRILFNWLYEVCGSPSYSLGADVYFLTTAIVDRFLLSRSEPLPRTKLQLVGVAAFLLATKLHRTSKQVEAKPLIELTDDAYVLDELVGMERTICSELQFHLHVPNLMEALFAANLSAKALPLLYVLQLIPARVPSLVPDIQRWEATKENPFSQCKVGVVDLEHAVNVCLAWKQRWPRSEADIRKTRQLTPKEWATLAPMTTSGGCPHTHMTRNLH